MIQIILVILIYILGPALLLGWVYKRFKSGVKPNSTQIFSVVVAIGLLGLMAYAIMSSSSKNDATEMADIIAGLTERYEFPVSAKFQDIPAVFGESRAHSLQIRIYGINDPVEYSKIQKIAKILHKQFASKPVVLVFYDQEVWQQKSDGTRFPDRANELKLQQIRIE